MTKQEAIKVLNMVEAYGIADEAKKVAISALEMNVPCSLCRFRYDNSGLCAKCPAMPIGRERV